MLSTLNNNKYWPHLTPTPCFLQQRPIAAVSSSLWTLKRPSPQDSLFSVWCYKKNVLLTDIHHDQLYQIAEKII